MSSSHYVLRVLRNNKMGHAITRHWAKYESRSTTQKDELRYSGESTYYTWITVGFCYAAGMESNKQPLEK